MSAQRPRSLLGVRALPALFFFSGASSLIFETIFTRLLTYTFGNTAYAASTVLAAFLGGLALGAFLIGRWIDRQPPSLRAYGVLELLAGLYALFIPFLFNQLTRIYVALYHDFHLGTAALTTVRFALAALVILFPTILMGGTLPVLARFVAAQSEAFQIQVSRLYAWNTLGAALGTLLSTYLLMPSLGVRAALGFACSINLTIFLTVIGSRSDPKVSLPQESEALCSTRPLLETTSRQGLNLVLLTAAFLIGAVALAYEVIWTHVLSSLIGNTVYAFGVTVFTFLLGLGWGAQVVAGRLQRPSGWARALAASQLFLGIAVFATIPLWNRVPDLFSQGIRKALEYDVIGIAFPLLVRILIIGWRVYRYPPGAPWSWRRVVELVIEGSIVSALLAIHPSKLWEFDAGPFVVAELFRFLCSFYLMIIPAVLLGMSFPLLLNLAGNSVERVGGSIGSVYAANTTGAIAGSVLTGFVLLPHWGSFGAMRVAGIGSLALGLALSLMWVELPTPRKLLLSAVASSLALVFWTSAPGWDAARISRGAYVYFSPGWPIQRVLYLGEDVQGGVTSVVDVAGSRTLLSNGKFQGNNTGEVGEQIRFALIPMLFARGFDRALVIGLGTGNTLRALARFPFRELDAVELAPHIVEAARELFEDVNDRVFDRDPRVHLSIADGRNFLLLSRQRYDLITTEVTSIWIGGEADLYNREFYRICREHMAEHGVLQQWVQIHHMRPQDILVILNTAAQVFPHAAFFVGPEQGLLIASPSPLEVDYRRLASYDADPGVRQELAAVREPSFISLLAEMVLNEDALRQAIQFLPKLSGLPQDFASTDYHPYLEYQTPKGNTLQYDTVAVNLRFIGQLRPASLPPAVPIRNLDSENEKNLAWGFIAAAGGQKLAAEECFRKVDGPLAARAGTELTRLDSSNYRGAP